MPMNYRLAIFFFLTVLGSKSVSARHSLVLQRGHSGTPVAMGWHIESRVLISVGEDGFLIVTKPEDKIVLHRFRVTRGRISKLDINQSNKKAAIVYAENGFSTVSVWNWASEEKIYEHRFNKELLFANWSARGTYLVLGALGSPSIALFDGATGRRLPRLQNLPSLYNNGYIGSTETILMTYATSGSIHYWDIDTSKLKHSAKTVSNLSDLSVLQTESKSILFAHQDDVLILLNRQTGYVLDRLTIPGLIDASIDKETGEVDAIALSIKGFILHRYQSRDNAFIPRGSEEGSFLGLDDSLQPVKVLRTDGTTYLMSKDGYLVTESTEGFTALIDDRLWKPNSLAFYDDSINIAGGGKILRFISPFFSGDSVEGISDLSNLSQEVIFSKSEAGHTGLLISSDGSFFLWDKDFSGKNNGIRRFHPSIPGSEFFFPSTDKILKCSLISEDRILTIDRNGVISVLDSENGAILAKHSSFDNLDAAYSVGGDFLIVGRSSRGSVGTPLEVIDMHSKETKPVPDKRLMVYLIESEPANIYTIGMTRTPSGKTETILLRHDPKRIERSKNLLRISGEVLNAIVLPHPADNSVYTNLSGEVVRILGNRTTAYEYVGPIVFLQIHGKRLYGLNADGSLVIWDGNNGNLLLQIHFFDDGAWVASSADTIWASSGAIDKIVILKDGDIVDPRLVCKILEN